MSVDSFKVLRKLSREDAFYFFTSIGNYTGRFARCLEEFLSVIKDVDVKSLEFHLKRGDFGKWIRLSIGDGELAERVGKLRDVGLKGDDLRRRLYNVVSERCRELESC
ncbi:MAG: DUF5752 family protein [Candidatus Bathyarchaeota archaeon]|nr:DUF5752 family protein [Candidatus Bathyarchaeota archaeon]